MAYFKYKKNTVFCTRATFRILKCGFTFWQICSCIRPCVCMCVLNNGWPSSSQTVSENTRRDSYSTSTTPTSTPNTRGISAPHFVYRLQPNWSTLIIKHEAGTKRSESSREEAHAVKQRNPNRPWDFSSGLVLKMLFSLYFYHFHRLTFSTGCNSYSSFEIQSLTLKLPMAFPVWLQC